MPFAPNPTDFSMLAAQGAQAPPDFAPVQLPPQGGGFQTAPNANYGAPPPELTAQLEKMKGLQATMVAQNQASADPLAGVTEVKTDFRDGMMSAKFHKDVLEGLMRDHQQLNEIRGSFHQEAQRLQAQEQQARSSPWIQLATALSANMAQQKDMPGWVQGLGATAAQLNPNPDQLAQRRLQVLGQEAQIAEKDMALGNTVMQMGQREDYQKAQLQAKADTLALAKQKEQDRAITEIARLSPTKTGVAQPREAVAAFLKAKGITDPAIVDAAYAAHTESAKAQSAALAEAQSNKVDLVNLKIEGSATADERKAGYKQAQIAQQIMGSMNRLDKSHEYAIGMKELGDSLSTDKDMSKVPPETRKNLVALDGIRRYSNSTRELLDLPEMQGYEGPLTPERLLPRFAQSPNLVKYNEWVNNELPRINRMIGGGIRMISSPENRAFLKSHLGFTENMTADQIRAVLDNVSKITDNETMTWMDGSPGAKWTKYPELLGPEGAKYAAVLAANPVRASASAPTVSGPAQGAKDSGGLHNKTKGNDPLDAALKKAGLIP